MMHYRKIVSTSDKDAQFYRESGTVLSMRVTYGRVVGNLDVAIALGDMTQLTNVDAWSVPHFEGGVSYGGVGAAVIRAGGEEGLRLLEGSIGGMRFGDVRLTHAGKARVKHLLHLVTVNSGKQREFKIVQNAVANGLSVASEAGLISVAFPALGTGILGSLTSRQSAQAMLSSIADHSNSGGSVRKIAIVIYGDNDAYRDFVGVLKDIESLAANQQQAIVGDREFDPIKWLHEFRFRDFDIASIGGMTEGEAKRIAKQSVDEYLIKHDIPRDFQRFSGWVRSDSTDAAELHRLQKVLHPDEVGLYLRSAFEGIYQTHIMDVLIECAQQLVAKYYGQIPKIN